MAKIQAYNFISMSTDVDTKVEGDLKVTGPSLTITIGLDATSGIDYTYAGTSTKALSEGQYQVVGLESGDQLVNVTVTTDSANVGYYEDYALSYDIVDAAGVSVKDKYEITEIKNGIEITKRTITVAAASAAKVYDGTALTNSDFEVVEGSEEKYKLLAGESVSVNMTARSTITHVGSTVNKIDPFSFTVAKADGSDSSMNYDFITEDGTLTVTKRTVLLISTDAEQYYDGTPLQNRQVIATGLEFLDVEPVVDGGFLAGDGCTYDFVSDDKVVDAKGNITAWIVSGQSDTAYGQTDVGSSVNEFNYHNFTSVYYGSEESDYEIIYGNNTPQWFVAKYGQEIADSLFGTLEVLAAPTSASEPVVTAETPATTLQGGAGTTYSKVEIKMTDYSWTYDFQSKTYGYFNDGYSVTLTTSDGVTETYGFEHNSDGEAGIKLNDTDTLYVTVTGQGGSVDTGKVKHVSDGEKQNRATWEVLRNGAEDVTDEYTSVVSIDQKSGVLKITPRNVELSTGSAIRVAPDGTPLSDNTVIEGGVGRDTGFIFGEGAAYAVTGEQSTAGSSWNTLEIHKYLTDTMATDYNFIWDEGLLQIGQVASIGETHYLTVTDALTAAKDGETVTIADGATDVVAVTAAAGSKATLDIGTTYVTEGAFTNAGALTLANGAFTAGNTVNTGDLVIDVGSGASLTTGTIDGSAGTLYVDVTGLKNTGFVKVLDTDGGATLESVNAQVIGGEATLVAIKGDLYVAKGLSQYETSVIAVNNAWAKESHDFGETVTLAGRSYAWSINAFGSAQEAVNAAEAGATLVFAGSKTDYGYVTFASAPDGLVLTTDGGDVVFEQLDGPSATIARGTFVTGDIALGAGDTLALGAGSVLSSDDLFLWGGTLSATSATLTASNLMWVEEGSVVELTDTQATLFGSLALFAPADASSALAMNGSTITVGGEVIINESCIVTMDETSTIAFDVAWTNDGTITVDMEGATAAMYRLVDNTGENEMSLADYGNVQLVNAGNYELIIVQDDLYAFDASQPILINGNYERYGAGDAIADRPGYFFFVNAMDVLPIKTYSPGVIEITGPVMEKGSLQAAAGTTLTIDAGASLTVGEKFYDDSTGVKSIGGAGALYLWEGADVQAFRTKFNVAETVTVQAVNAVVDDDEIKTSEQSVGAGETVVAGSITVGAEKDFNLIVDDDKKLVVAGEVKGGDEAILYIEKTATGSGDLVVDGSVFNFDRVIIDNRTSEGELRIERTLIAKEVWITNDGGHVEASVLAEGDVKIIQGNAPETLVGDYTGANVFVTNTTDGGIKSRVQDVTLQAVGTKAKAGTVTLEGDKGTSFAGDTRVVAGNNAETPEDITANDGAGTVILKNFNAFTGVYDDEGKLVRRGTVDVQANAVRTEEKDDTPIVLFQDVDVTFSSSVRYGSRLGFLVGIAGETNVSGVDGRSLFIDANRIEIDDGASLGNKTNIYGGYHLTVGGNSTLKDGARVSAKDAWLTFDQTLNVVGDGTVLTVKKLENKGTINLSGAIAVDGEGNFKNTGTLNWDLTGDSVGSIDWADVDNAGTLAITVGADQAFGTYTLATGDFTSVAGKDTFTLKGVEASEATLTVNGAVTYGERTYALTTQGNGTAADALVLTVLAAADMSSIAVNTAWAGTKAGETVTLGGKDYMFGVSAFAEAQKAADAVAAETQKVVFVGGETSYGDVSFQGHANKQLVLATDGQTAKFDQLNAGMSTYTPDLVIDKGASVESAKLGIWATGSEWQQTVTLEEGSTLTLTDSYSSVTTSSLLSNGGIVLKQGSRLVADKGITLYTYFNTSASHPSLTADHAEIVSTDGALKGQNGWYSTLTLKNGSRAAFASVDFKGTMSLDNSTISVSGDWKSDAEISMDETSQISFGGNWENDWSITVDMDGATAARYVLVDNSGDTAMTLADYGTVELVNAGNYELAVVDNDLVALTKVSAAITVKAKCASRADGTERLWDIVEGELLEGDTFVATVVSTPVKDGVEVSSITSYMILRGTEDVTAQYVVTTLDSTIAADPTVEHVTVSKAGAAPKVAKGQTLAIGTEDAPVVVDFTAKNVTVTVNSTGALDVHGELRDAAKINVVAGTKKGTGDKAVVTDTVANLGGVFGTTNLTTGKFTDVTADYFGGTTKADKVTVGADAKFAGGDLDLGSGADALSVGADTTFAVGDLVDIETVTFGARSENTVADVTGAQKITLAAGRTVTEKVAGKTETKIEKTTLVAGDVTMLADKANAITLGKFDEASFGDVTFGEKNDKIAIGDEATATFGLLDFGGGKDTLTVGKKSTFQAVATSEGAASLTKFTIGRESTAYLSSELIAQGQKVTGASSFGRGSTIVDIGSADAGIAQNFTSLETERADNAADAATTLVIGTVNGWISDVKDADGGKLDTDDYFTADKNLTVNVSVTKGSYSDVFIYKNGERIARETDCTLAAGDILQIHKGRGNATAGYAIDVQLA